MKSVSVLIGNRTTWDAIILTISSILKRTKYPRYEIIVSDNSMAPNNRVREYHPETPEMEDDGTRLEYLKEQAEKGNIKLIENTDQEDKYGHGENIKKLLKNCKTDYALLFVSTAEILEGDWIQYLVWLIEADPGKNLGVALEKPASNHFDQQWLAPVYWPNVMLLNMELYRDFGNIDTDWDLDRDFWPSFPHKELFDGLKPLAEPDHDPARIFCDTGYKLWERVNYQNPKGLKMAPLHHFFWNPWRKTNKISLFLGMDRNSHRPQIEFMQKRFREIKTRLEWLRKE